MASKPALEIAVVPVSGFASATAGAGENAKQAFDTLGAVLADAIAPLREKLASGVAAADEIELETELALKAGGSWVVVSMEGTATVKVRLLWKKNA
jgi:hypothetical protein